MSSGTFQNRYFANATRREEDPTAPTRSSSGGIGLVRQDDAFTEAEQQRLRDARSSLFCRGRSVAILVAVVAAAAATARWWTSSVGPHDRGSQALVHEVAHRAHVHVAIDRVMLDVRRIGKEHQLGSNSSLRSPRREALNVLFAQSIVSKLVN